ncbi:unnamed protein product [Rotaria sordida]|uniref:TIR domain-containing protein n=1 Tax=Rotaria sordida TaxID=392033 RepID=A0A814YPW1_9BILA|nr:unnamed protein product [Rotaria sordida]CAF1231487.1 unnamed protein product [Rotaria sordida]
MTTNNDPIFNCIHQLETLLFHDDMLKKIESHPLINLRDQLQKIDDEWDIRTIDENQKRMSTLNYFEINSFSHFIKRYSSIIPSNLLEALFDAIRFQMYINMAIYPVLCDYYFDLSLTYLINDSTINYLINKKHILSNMDEYFLHLFASIGARSLYTRRGISYSIFVSHKNIPTFFQLNNSTERLLQAFITYINNYFLNNDQQSQVYTSIFKWILNMTDIYGFVPYFVQIGYPNAILQWISIERDHIKYISLESWSCIINILHNLARHPIGVKALNELKMIDSIKQWKEQYLSESSVIDYNEDDKDIRMAYYLLYAKLLEPKELKNESVSNIQTILDYILEQTMKAFDSVDLTCGPYNVCEYLEGLVKLVVNDALLTYIISRDNIYELFIEKFLLFNNICESTVLNTIICSSLYTIFWSISFLSEYSIKLKLNNEFLSFVEQRAKNQSNDEYELDMKRAAKGILFNLDCIQMDIQPIEDNHNHDDDDDNQIKVMISYSHKDAKFCKNLVTKIQEHYQGDIWVDFNKLSPPYEDDWEEIAKAITQCNVIVMIVTENYCGSKSCRREVVHADKRNKRMVPVYIGKDYIPEDWFEIRAGSATWVRFGGEKNDEEVMETLLGLITVRDEVPQNNNKLAYSHGSHLKLKSKSEIDSNTITNIQTIETSSLHVNTNPIIEISDIQLQSNLTVSDIIPTSPIEQWTCEEVQQWLHLPPSTLQLSSGRALLTYMKLLSHDDAQYDEYEHRMRDHCVSREQFSNLISSFTSILSLNDAQTISTKLPDQWTRNDIKYWFQQNHLSDYLLNALNFIDGSQLIIYGQLIIDSPLRIEEEYNRLRNKIGKDLFHLDEYSRFLSGLKKLVNQSRLKEESALCNIL